MKPHRLTMKAFGPFAKETVVDFDSMGNSIYLISGDTGSGKTTIFDGIIYALYGTASGEERSSLGTEAFHSDYAKEGAHREEMRVFLDFSNGGRRFAVSRRMYWGKRGSAQKPVKESTLSENGSVIVNGRGREDLDDVTVKVKEILGLDADQFRRIIMLAQGEFQRFLTAKSDERGVILGKLYDNRRHQDLQLRLKAAQTLLQEQDEDLAREAGILREQFFFPEELPSAHEPDEEETFAKEDSLISVDHPKLLETLSRIITGMSAERDSRRSVIQAKDKQRMELEALRVKGESGNLLLDQLDAVREQLALHQGQKQQKDELRALLYRVEAAQKALPSEREMLQAGEDRERIYRRIKALEEERENLAAAAASLKRRADTLRGENDPRIASLLSEKSALENMLHLYDDLARDESVLSARKETVKKAEENLADELKRLREGRKAQKELAEKLESLSQAGDLAVSAAKRSLDDLTKRKNQLREVESDLGTVRELERDMASTAERYEEAKNAEIRAETEHLRLNAAFLRGQAGILAQEMQKKLQTQQVVICPVCGSSHTEKDIGSFAKCREDVPSREQVDAALEAWNIAAEAARGAGEAYHTKKTALQQKKEALLRTFRGLITPEEGETVQKEELPETENPSSDACPGWELLAEGTLLVQALSDCERQEAEAAKTYRRARSDREEKENAAAAKEKADREVISAQEGSEKASAGLNEAQLAEARARSGAESRRKLLEGFPQSKADAQRSLSLMKKQMDELAKQTENAASELDECRRKQSENEGSLAAARLEKEERERSAERAEERFSAVLREQSFADVDEYHRALAPEGRLLDAEKLAVWIGEKSAELEEYDRKGRDYEAAIRQLRESTKGVERTDIPAVTRQINVLVEELEVLQADEKELASNLRTNQRILARLSKVQNRRAIQRKISEKLTPLSQTANGNYAFSRYVLGGFFHKIVEQANIHLDTMTDGEYRLVPTQEGDRRASLGLGLKVLNTITNLERETASLSGGQMFEASLALALGLSDVVQMESTGTIQIDSMFIDEGFGSLDGVRLDRAIEVLAHLSSGKRQIGIISHVARLDECLPRKIRVIAGQRGSSVQTETDC